MGEQYLVVDSEPTGLAHTVMAESIQDTPDRVERGVCLSRKSMVKTKTEIPKNSSNETRGPSIPIRIGNAKYSRIMQLHCRTQFRLVINKDAILGTEADMHEFAILEFSSAGFGGLVRIKGVKSNLYLAMNKDGRLYGELNSENEETIFIEGVLGQYNTYMSHKFKTENWYVGIKKNGNPKHGFETRWGQKAIQFLPIRSKTSEDMMRETRLHQY